MIGYSSGKENRFCYYIGGLEESATGILGEMSNPMSWGMPMDKVCEKLKKKDAQICDLRYGEYPHIHLLVIRDQAVSPIITDHWQCKLLVKFPSCPKYVCA